MLFISASVLANPPDDYPAPVCLLGVAPPFLVELCHRRHEKLVLAVSFNLVLLNDQDSLTIPPCMTYLVGLARAPSPITLPPPPRSDSGEVGLSTKR